MTKTRIFIALVLGAAFGIQAGQTAAQTGPWPNRPIHFLVPLPPGGSPDYLSRLLAEHLQPVFGQAFIVENKPGAAGNIARE